MADQKPAEQALRTYRGNCHCGAFVFEAQLPEIKTAYECNCSICSKKGYLWNFPPPDGFKVVKGSTDDTLKSYSFLTGKYSHKFCPNCGIPVMAVRADAPPGRKIGVNIRVLQGVSAWPLEVKSVPGASIEPQYEAPVYTGPEPDVDVEGGNIYHGSCHCGAVKVVVKMKPLDETYDERLLEGDCSICSRGAYIWVYPNKDQIVIEGRENLGYYVFATTVWRKMFCKHCGVHIGAELNPKTEEEVAALPESDQQWRARVMHINPITLRMLNDVDWRKLKPTHSNCSELPHEYVNP